MTVLLLGGLDRDERVEDRDRVVKRALGGFSSGNRPRGSLSFDVLQVVRQLLLRRAV
jgi:hypothetical protein